MKLVLLSLALLSGIAKAQNLSDFERGYNEGQNTCRNEVWACSAICTITRPNGDNSFKRDESVSQEGFTRGEAMMKLINYKKEKNDCRAKVLEGKARCEKL